MTNLEFAIIYALKKWCIFPLRFGSKGGEINGKSGQLVDWKNATCDLTQVEKWWKQWPDANIGLYARKSGLVIIDVDKKEIVKNKGIKEAVRNGFESLVTLEKYAGELKRTCTQRTQGGGLHILCRHDDVPTLRAGTDGIDFKYNGYTLLEPSVFVRDDGSTGTYTWLKQGEPEALSDTWVAYLHPSSKSSSDLDLTCMHHDYTQDAVTITERDIADIKLRFEEIGPRGENNNTIRDVVRTIYHDFGCGNETGDKLMLEWAGDLHFGPLLTPDAAMRQVYRLSNKFDTEEAKVDCKIRGLWAVGVLAGGVPAEQELSDENILTELEKISAGFLSGVESPVVRSIPTMFPQLDKYIGGGISTRQLTTIMGGPGSGKTSFLISLLQDISCDENTKQSVLYVSTEIECPELISRLAACDLNRPWRDIVRDKNARDEKVRVNTKKRFYLLDRDSMPEDTDRCLAHIERLVEGLTTMYGTPPIVCVDYLQDMVPSSPDVRKDVEKLSKWMVTLSKKRDCAVLVVCSIARAGYGKLLEAARETNSPHAYLPLAKESGKIEYDAGTCIFLDRIITEQDSQQTKYNTVMLVVCKSRHGEVGFVGAEFEPRVGTYRPAPLYTPGVPKVEKKDDLNEKILAIVRENPKFYNTSELKKKIGGAQAVTGYAIKELVREKKLSMINNLLVLVD